VDLIIKALVIMATLANILLRTVRVLCTPVPKALSVKEHLAMHGIIFHPDKRAYLRGNRMVEGWELLEAMKDGF